MVDKSTKSAMTILGMLIAAGVVLLALVLSADAQDFDPERRPEEGLYFSLPFNNGSTTPVAQLSTAPTAVGTMLITGNGTLLFPDYLVNGGHCLWWADRPEWRTRPLTATCWYKNNWRAYMNNTRFFGTVYYSSNTGGYWGFIDDAYNSTTEDYPTFVVGSGSPLGNVQTVMPYNGLVVGQWGFFALAVDASGTARAYRNGVLLGIMTVNSFGSPNSTDGARLLIGQGATGPNSIGLNSGGCEIDDPRVYAGKALSADEIYAIYASGRTGQGDNQP